MYLRSRTTELQGLYLNGAIFPVPSTGLGTCQVLDTCVEIIDVPKNSICKGHLASLPEISMQF